MITIQNYVKAESLEQAWQLNQKRSARIMGGMMWMRMGRGTVQTAVDLSGRSYLGYAMQIPTEKVGDFDTELVEEFWLGFVRNAACTLHIRMLSGTNSHHIIEGCFKSVARSLRKAVSIDEKFADDIPSTKGVL